jgi:hypothetical protein
MKAQLRAHVYSVLEQGDKVSTSSPLFNKQLKDFLSTTSGRLVASLVRCIVLYRNVLTKFRNVFTD